MENVRGITSKIHKSGLNFPEFIKNLMTNGDDHCHYDIENILINTLDYGLAQTRIRWFLIGVRRDLNTGSNCLRNIMTGIKIRRTRKVMKLVDVIGDLPHIESGEGSDVMEIIKGKQLKTIYNHRAMKHGQPLLDRFSHVPVGGGLINVPRELLTDHLIRMLEGQYGNGGHIKNIYGRLDWQKPCGTIVAGIDKITCGRFVHPEANRLLTPRECARIQSFADDFRFQGSLVNQYYMIGNAVPPKISFVIANSIAKALEN